MASSDQPGVLFTAFRKGQEYALHILNLGAARPAEPVGLPEAEWRVVESTEAAQWGERGATLAPPGRRNPASLGVSPPMHRYSELRAKAVEFVTAHAGAGPVLVLANVRAAAEEV